MDQGGDAKKHPSEALARASASLADQQVADFDDAETEDISTILNGNKAITGKAVWSANYASRVSDHNDTDKRNQEHSDAVDKEIRELMHLSEWNAQMTTVGGVQMSNEEAQRCRQHIIDNEDAYADRAVREGRISADQKEEYKWAIRRIKELEDKKGRGTITAEEEKECDRVKRSQAGQAAQKDTGRTHLEGQGYVPPLNNDVAKAASSARSTIFAAPDSTMFQSAPTLSNHFEDAKAATTPLDKASIPVVAPPAQRVRAMGLDV